MVAQVMYRQMHGCTRIDMCMCMCIYRGVVFGERDQRDELVGGDGVLGAQRGARRLAKPTGVIDHVRDVHLLKAGLG